MHVDWIWEPFMDALKWQITFMDFDTTKKTGLIEIFPRMPLGWNVMFYMSFSQRRIAKDKLDQAPL